MANFILEMKQISKSFFGVPVLTNVNLSITPGEVHALMGENGAGKSTLMKILMGIHPADTGTIYLEGSEIKNKTSKEAMEKGIVMIHQELNPVLDMKVFENIFLGREFRTRLGLVDNRLMTLEARKLLESLEIDIPVNVFMRSLSVAQCQLIEIIKAISMSAKVVIMDEPTSALTDSEVLVLFKQIQKLRESGVSIIYISHKIDEIFQLCNRITVLRDGCCTGVKSADEITKDELIKLMIGRDISDIFPKTETKIGETVFEVRNLKLENKFHDINFSVREGEIFGLAGLVGAGRSEVVETIFGIRKKTAGSILIKGKEVTINKPSDAIKHRIALITEDRKRSGLNQKGSVCENITIVALRDFTNFGIIKKKIEKTAAEEQINKLSVKTPGLYTIIKNLSGGNQQKVVLAKWLLKEADIIILDEPTRGIDVGAKRDIYLLIDKLTKEGKAIIFISSEMLEVIGLCDRIIVMAEGNITGQLLRQEFSEEKIMTYATHFKEKELSVEA
jgi:ABC-type sugar transport system ATPase subunit